MLFVGSLNEIDFMAQIILYFVYFYRQDLKHSPIMKWQINKFNDYKNVIRYHFILD